MVDFSAKDVITKYFYEFSDNLMKLVQENGAMTLSGFPGLILAFCCVAEVVYIILDNMSGKPVIPRILKFSLYLGLTLIVFGRVSYAGLNLTSGLPATYQPKGAKGDLLRDTHSFLRYYFDQLGATMTGSSNREVEVYEEGKATGTYQKSNQKGDSVVNTVKKNGLIRFMCDIDTAKDACLKKYEKMDYLAVEGEFDKAYECGDSFTDLGGCFSRLKTYFSMEMIFVLIIKILYVFRFIGFCTVLMGYILTLVMTYMMLKLLFPFIVFEKTRDQILKSIKFFLSTTTIVALMTFLEFVFTLSMGSLVMTLANTPVADSAAGFAQFTIYFYLTACLIIILFGVEVIMYFKIPEISKQIWELNLGALVTLSEVAKDGMKMGLQLLGLGAQIGSVGVLTGAGKFAKGGQLLGKMFGGAGGGGGAGPVGGGVATPAPKSNLSGNTSSGGSYPGRDESTNGHYAPKSDNGTSTTRPAPEPQVNPAELEKPKKPRKKSSSTSTSDSPETNTQGSSNDSGTTGSSGSQTPAASSGSPKSDVDAGFLKNMAQSAKSKLSAAASATGNGISATGKGIGAAARATGRGVSAVGSGLVSAATSETAKSWASSAKGLAGDAMKMGLNAAAGNLGESFNDGIGMAKKGTNKLDDIQKDDFDSIRDAKWSKLGMNANDLNTPEFDDVDTLTNTSEYDQVVSDLGGYEEKITAARVKLDKAQQDLTEGKGSFDESAKARSQVEKLESEMEEKTFKKKEMEDKYASAKRKLIEDLKAGIIDKTQRGQFINLLGKKDGFTSSEINELVNDPEAAGLMGLAELERQTQKNMDYLKNKVNTELSKHGMISASTEKEMKAMREDVPNEFMKELWNKINSESTVNYEKVREEREKAKKNERETRNKKK